MARQPLTLPEAAEELGVHYMTVYRYVRTGRLPAKRVEAWQIDRRPQARAATRAGGRRRRPTGPAPSVPRLEARLIAGDEGGAWTLLEAALASGTTPEDLLLELIGPTLVGHRDVAGSEASSRSPTNTGRAPSSPGSSAGWVPRFRPQGRETRNRQSSPPPPVSSTPCPSPLPPICCAGGASTWWSSVPTPRPRRSPRRWRASRTSWPSASHAPPATQPRPSSHSSGPPGVPGRTGPSRRSRHRRPRARPQS